jgi:hypothetical protein
MSIRVDDPVTVQTVTVEGVTGRFRQVVVLLPETDAEALAAARIARSPSDLLAADCKPVAHAVADALVAAGLGRS